MKDQAGFSLGGRGALKGGGTTGSSPLENAGSPLEANLRTLEIVLCNLESQISLLRDKTYPIRSVSDRKESPIPCSPPTAGSGPVNNSLAEFTSRIHSAATNLEEIIESLEV